MTWYQILTLCGFPSICVIIISAVSRKVGKMIKEKEQADINLKAGVQALLRTKMIDVYNKWSERGYAPIYAKDNFENMYKAYHNLGFNGVMDDMKVKFLSLPNEPKGEKK